MDSKGQKSKETENEGKRGLEGKAKGVLVGLVWSRG